MAVQRFVVQFDRRTVGIAVRVPGGFMFHASNKNFEKIDGRLFRRARAVEREVSRVGKQQERMRHMPAHITVPA
jgi:hypothetical protein